MIHLTTEDLLAMKDGEGTAWARRHHGECPECQKELDALHQRSGAVTHANDCNTNRM